MTDPSRRGGWDQEHPGTYSYPVDPGETYGQRPPYGSNYQAPASPNPTRHLPAYAPPGYQQHNAPGGPPNPPGGVPPEPPDPKDGGSRTWLWILAGGALLLVVGLILSLFIDSSSQEPMGSPPATAIEPSLTKPSSTTPPSTTTQSATPSSTPSSTTQPSGTSAPGALHTVVYTVAGEGRAINIVYLDSGGVLQTEFNVMLPWSKQVQLAGQANSSASVSIFNVGREVTCSINVDGVETLQRTGVGFTLCTSFGTN